ncbi:MAG: hypothetical protein A2X85_00665 [Geobacteraceae bacterium GWF2_54_21]|nr:MAG: hypothetical protein A2X85_00665 [Geobacteraceae bacterium GWF2_54_21]
MTAPRKAFKLFKIFDETCSQWVQVDVADQFKQVWLFFADNRLVTVLKQMAGTSMAPVERDGIAGQQPSHEA